MKSFLQKAVPVLITITVILLMVQSGPDRPLSSYPLPEPPDTVRGPSFRPSEWIWLQRTFPHGHADTDVYSQAVKQTRTLHKTASTKEIEWEFAGPENIGGRIVDIAFDPENPEIVYAAAATGGIFKSVDGGYSWFAIFDDQAVLSIGDIAVDPVNTDILYAGTGEANGGHNNFPGGGVYKSTDGGLSWNYMGLEATRSIGRILVNPENPDQVFVAATGSYFGPDPYRGVFVSNDGGISWDYSLFVSDSTGAIDLVMDPQNPFFMMAAMWERVRRPVNTDGTHLFGQTSGIYRTRDGGVKWERLGSENGLPNAAREPVGRIGLAMYPGNADSIYAFYSDGSNYSGLFRTTDGGDHWGKRDPGNQIADGTGGFSWYFGQIRVSPVNPETIYVMDVAFMRSEDGGDNFPLRDGYGNTKNLHVDHHALAFHPRNPSHIINGNDGGINISYDGGDDWFKVASLPVTQFYEIGLDPQYPERLYGGTQDNGTLRTRDGGLDTWERILGGDGFYVIVDPQDPGLVYAEYQFGNLFRIEDGQSTRITNDDMMADSRNWSTPVVMDPNNSRVLYYGGSRLYRTEDRGDNWEFISDNLTRELSDSRIGTITTIAVSPVNSDIIYAGTDDGMVWVSFDYGENWNDITGNLPFRWVTRVVADPEDAGTVYVTFSGLKWKEAQPHVFRSADAGSTWQDISSNLPDAPVNAFAIDPMDTNILYCGTDVGVFVSFNAGKIWEPLGSNIPVVVINDMKIHRGSYELIVGTHGRSMYRLDLEKLTGLSQPVASSTPPLAFQLYQNKPNPFNGTTDLSFYLSRPGRMQLQIFDARGRHIRVYAGFFSEGSHSLRWNGRDSAGKQVASGIYFYTLSLNDPAAGVDTKKMIILR